MTEGRGQIFEFGIRNAEIGKGQAHGLKGDDGGQRTRLRSSGYDPTRRRGMQKAEVGGQRIEGRLQRTDELQQNVDKKNSPGTAREYLSSNNKLADVRIWKADGRVPGHRVD